MAEPTWVFRGLHELGLNVIAPALYVADRPAYLHLAGAGIRLVHQECRATRAAFEAGPEYAAYRAAVTRLHDNQREQLALGTRVQELHQDVTAAIRAGAAGDVLEAVEGQLTAALASYARLSGREPTLQALAQETQAVAQVRLNELLQAVAAHWRSENHRQGCELEREIAATVGTLLAQFDSLRLQRQQLDAPTVFANLEQPLSALTLPE